MIQDPRVSNSSTFNSLLVSAQQETRKENLENISIDIFLLNEQRININIQTVEQTDSVLSKVCSQLNVPEEFQSCFSLFLIRRDFDGDITIVRKLQDFESPYISQKALSTTSTLMGDKEDSGCFMFFEVIIVRTLSQINFIRSVMENLPRHFIRPVIRFD